MKYCPLREKKIQKIMYSNNAEIYHNFIQHSYMYLVSLSTVKYSPLASIFLCALPLGTPWGEGLYLTVSPLSCPNMYTWPKDIYCTWPAGLRLAGRLLSSFQTLTVRDLQPVARWCVGGSTGSSQWWEMPRQTDSNASWTDSSWQRLDSFWKVLLFSKLGKTKVSEQKESLFLMQI